MNEAALIGIFDAQDKGAAVFASARRDVVEQGRPQRAQVQVTSWGRRETRADGQIGALTEDVARGRRARLAMRLSLVSRKKPEAAEASRRLLCRR